MNNLLGFLSIVVILGGVLVATKPGDQECILQVRQAAGSGDLLTSLAADLVINRHTVTIEDHVFYKNIYAVTGDRVGTAFFGTVFLSR
jgi:hypothetical protein